MKNNDEFGEDDDEFLSPEFNAQTEELSQQMENARCETTPASTLDKACAQTSDERIDLRNSVDSGQALPATSLAIATRMPKPSSNDIFAAVSEQVEDEWTRYNNNFTRDDEWDANANRLHKAELDAFGLPMNIVPSARTSEDPPGTSQDEPTDSRGYYTTGERTGPARTQVLSQKNLRKKFSNPVYVSNDWSAAINVVPTDFQPASSDAAYSFATVNPKEPIEVRVVLPESATVYAVRVERLQSAFITFEAEFTSFYYNHVPESMRLREAEIAPGLACVHFFRDIGPRRALIVAVDSARQFHVRQVDYARMVVLVTAEDLYPLEQRFLNAPISALHITRENATMDEMGPLPVNSICTMTIHEAEPETFFVDLVPRVQPTRKSGRTSFGLTPIGCLRHPVQAGGSEQQYPADEELQRGGHDETAVEDPFDESTWTSSASQKHAEPRVAALRRRFSNLPDAPYVPAFTQVSRGRRFRQGAALVNSDDGSNTQHNDEGAHQVQQGMFDNDASLPTVGDKDPSLEERPEYSQQSRPPSCITVKQQWARKWLPQQATS